LTAADDEPHTPRPGTPDWAETAWFAAAVSQRGLGIWTYPLFRTDLGVAAVAVYVWGPGAARQADGGGVQGRGEVLSQVALHTTPYLAWVSQVRWRPADGTEMTGEGQDISSPRAWRTASRRGW
jgi:hypothetical protein